MRATVDPRLASDLRMAVMRLSRRLRRERSDDSLTTSHLSALATIERAGRISLGELAAQEYVRPPSMTRIATALEQGGLVCRSHHATDGRQVMLEVTETGLGLLAADRRRRDAWLCQRLSEVSQEDRATLRSAVAILERLAAS